MNARRQRPESDEKAMVQELAALLPPAGQPHLTDKRHTELKEHLVGTITQQYPDAPSAISTWTRSRWPLLMAPVALAAAVAATVMLTPGTPATSPATSISPVVAVRPGSSHGVTLLLDEVADSVPAAPAQPVRSDQYIYLRSEVAFSRATKQRTFDGPVALDAVHERQVWLPQDRARLGLIREGGHDMQLHDVSTTYAQVAELPTDPTVLLQRIYADTQGHAPSRDGAAFDWIGEAIDEAIVPAPVEAAIWRTAARIPGVAVIPDATDAAGRHGVAVAHTDNGERTEYIFDKNTHAYLGERSYLVRNTSEGKAGMLTASTAVLLRAIVDKTGQVPAETNNA
jgi:hypothetical protein